MAKIVVTGGTGHLAAYLQRLWSDRSDVFYVDSSQYDLRNEEAVDHLFRTQKPTVLVHLAARVGGIEANRSSKKDFLLDNVRMNLNVLDYADRYNVERMVLASSTCAFPEGEWNGDYPKGCVGPTPMTEEDIHSGMPEPTSIGYAYSKRLMTLHGDLIREDVRNGWRAVTTLHFCNLFGEFEPWDKPETLHFVPALILKMVQSYYSGSKISLLGTGTPYRQFMFMNDAARAIDLAISERLCGDYCVATTEYMTIADMAVECLKACNMTSAELVWDSNVQNNGQRHKIVSDQKWQEAVGGFEYSSFTDSVRRVYDHLWHGVKDSPSLYIQSK